MERIQTKSIRSFLIIAIMFTYVDLFAKDARGGQSLMRSRNAHTEAAIGGDCNCTVFRSQSEANKRNYSDIAKFVDQARPSYFKKYHIREFLDEAIAKDPQKRGAIEDSLNKNLVNLPLQEPLDLVGARIKNGSTEAEVNIAISNLLAAIGKDVPAVRDIAEKYVVRLHANASMNDKGAQMGQMKSVSIGSKNQAVNGNLSYSVCDKKSNLDFGFKMGCPYEKKVFGDFQYEVGDAYTGVSFSSTNSESSEYKDRQASVIFGLKF